MTRQSVYSTRKKVSPLRRAKWGVQRKWRGFKNLSKKKKFAIIGSPILAFLVVVPVATYIYYYNDIADQTRLMNANNTGVVLLDSSNEPFYTIGRAEHRDTVPLDKIAEPMKHALIASEDKDFYKNNGFSLTGIGRALFQNVSTGSIRGGGSTITQQLAKNTLLSNNQTFLRKYQELTIAIAIDQRYSKDQILEMYLNSVFFGGTNFGVEQAANFYFNKAPDQLDLAESAMLVGILPAPNAYSPTLGSMEYAVKRQHTVLDRMVKTKYITQEQADAAAAEQLQFAEPNDENNSIAPNFAELVMNELNKKYGAENVLRSGYQVKTTLDKTMQEQLVVSIQNHLPSIQRKGGSNAAGLAVDPTNGNIKAMVGSADYNNAEWGKVDMTSTARQPGSSFKTIYYSAALDSGTITPATILKDIRTDFGGYVPLDADKRFRGDVTTRQSIAQSLNIPSVEIMQKFGIDSSIAAAKKYGITTLDASKNYGLSLALGSAEVPLNQMTSAYAAIANNGMGNERTAITQVNDKFNKKIFESQPKPYSTISSQAAWLTSNMLSDNSARAAIFGNSLTIPGRKVAVKTGTTNDNRDAWTIGYTPQIALGVWVGNNDNAEMLSGGSDMAGPIWVNTMRQYLANAPSDSFGSAPGGVVQKAVCTGTGALAAKAGVNTYNEYFLSNHLPTGSCEAEQKPVVIDVCELSNKQMVQIDEKDFDSTKYSKNADDCKKKTIQACDLSSGQVVAIDEEAFDSTKYSRDTTNCKPKTQATTIQVCDLTTNQVVTINESDYNSTRYSKDLTKCPTIIQPPQSPLPVR